MGSHRRPRRQRQPPVLLTLLVLLLATGIAVGYAVNLGGGRVAQVRSAATVPDQPAGTRLLTIPSGYASAGRRFVLDQPAGGGPPRPLVLLLHGLYQSPTTVERATDARSFSGAAGFTLAYPIGEDEAWDAGGCCGGDKADDVTYLVDLVHYVETLTPVERTHVYIWGFSNGGMMAWRAVCQTDGVFAGAGVVAGALLVPCPRVVHVVAIYGAKDHTVPYFGGFSRYTHTVMPNSATTASRLLPGSTYEWRIVAGLGHAWPPKASGVDALSLLWNGLRGYSAAVSAATVG